MKSKTVKTKRPTYKQNVNKLIVIKVETVLSYGGIKWYKGKYVRTIKE